MSDFPPPLDAGPVGMQPIQPATTSKWAIASLVCGLLVCAPFVAPALGLIFGVIALVTISGSAGRRRGNGLAAAGLVISLAVLVVDFVGTSILLKKGIEVANKFVQPIEELVLDLEAGDLTAARARLAATTSNAVTDDDLTQLADRFDREFGAIKAASLDFGGQAYLQPGAPPPTGFNPNQMGNAAPAVPIPVQLEFETTTVFGLLLVTDNPALANSPTIQWDRLFLIDSFTIFSPDGAWTFPPKADESDDAPAVDDEENGD